MYNPASTPILNKTSGNHNYASETHDRDSANYCLTQETSGLFLGSTPPPKFLKRFLLIDQNIPECLDSKGALQVCQAQRKSLTCITCSYMVVLLSAPTVLHQYLIDNRSDCL